jgi:hypothetical protein
MQGLGIDRHKIEVDGEGSADPSTPQGRRGRLRRRRRRRTVISINLSVGACWSIDSRAKRRVKERKRR